MRSFNFSGNPAGKPFVVAVVVDAAEASAFPAFSTPFRSSAILSSNRRSLYLCVVDVAAAAVYQVRVTISNAIDRMDQPCRFRRF
jgi:hypothetical protein